MKPTKQPRTRPATNLTLNPDVVAACRVLAALDRRSFSLWVELILEEKLNESGKRELISQMTNQPAPGAYRRAESLPLPSDTTSTAGTVADTSSIAAEIHQAKKNHSASPAAHTPAPTPPPAPRAPRAKSSPKRAG